MLKNFLPVIFCLFIVSCDNATTVSGTGLFNENILRIDVPVPFSSLNPADPNDCGSTVIFPLLYSYLFIPDENGRLKPDLAESWTYNPETLMWTIALRTDAFFHNGRPVTSKEVKYSFFTFLKIHEKSLMDAVQDVFILSDSKLSIGLKNNDPDFMKKIWVMEILPQPDERSECEPLRANDPPNGSGPFVFKSRIGDSQVVLKANKNYFQALPSIDRVVFYYQPDIDNSWARMVSGKTDVVYEMTPKNHDILKQYEDRFYFDYYTLHRYSILLYNTHDVLFSDPKVRRALTHAIDRDYIVAHLLKGYGKVGTGPMGIDSPYHNPALYPLSYDPQKSLELLRQAGWTLNSRDKYLYKDKHPFAFTLLVFKGFQADIIISRYIKLCLNDIGIKMSIQRISLDEIVSRYVHNDKFQAVLTVFSDCQHRPEHLKDLWSPRMSEFSAAGGFSHPEVTKLLDQAFSEKDLQQKKEYLQKADALIASLQPGTFLFHKTALDVLSRRFFLPERFSLSQEGIYRLKDASLKHE